MVLHRNARTGEHFSQICAKEFKDTPNRLDLVDLPLLDGKWT